MGTPRCSLILYESSHPDGQDHLPFITHSSCVRSQLKWPPCLPNCYSQHNIFPSLEHLTQDIIMHFYVWPLLLPDYKRHSGAVINISILRVSDQYLAYHRHSASIYWMNEWSLCFDILFFLGLFVCLFVFFLINCQCLYVSFNDLSRHGFSGPRKWRSVRNDFSL